jgi:hypothetical protein
VEKLKVLMSGPGVSNETKPPSNTGRWQFSLRTLLLVMAACAVLAGTYGVFGDGAFVWILFLAGAVTPAAALKRSLRLAYLTALVAIWGPFIVMATYMVLFVACSHCKEAAWSMLPYSPGLVLLELAHHLVDLPRLDGSISYAASLLVSFAVLAGLTWIVQSCGWWLRAFILVVAWAFFAFCAFGLMAAIRA